MNKLKVALGAILVVAGVVMLTGCEKAAEAEVVTGAENDFRVARLFTVDGCTAYRFYDNGRAIYYTDCKGSTNWRVQNGKVTNHYNTHTNSDR